MRLFSLRNFVLPIVGGACLSACTVIQEPAETVTGTYLSGRLAARVNDTQTAAQQYGRVQAVVPVTTTQLRQQTFLYQLLSGDMPAAVVSAKSLQSSAAASKTQGADNQADPLVTLTLAVDDLRKGRYAQTRSQLAPISTQGLYRSIVFVLQAWAIAGEQSEAEAIAHLKNPPPDMFTGFSPLHVAMLAENRGDDKEARAGYQLSFFTLGGPVGRRRFADYLAATNDLTAAREANALLLNQQGPTRRIAQKNLAKLDRGDVGQKTSKTTPQEAGAIALYTFGAAIAEQIYTERENAADAGFTLRDPELTQPIAMMQLALSLDPALDEANRFLGTLNNINGQHDEAIKAFANIKSSSAYYEQSRIEISGALDAQDKQQEAIGVLEKLIAADPLAHEARLVLSGAYARQDRYEASVKVLDDAIADIEDDPYEDRWRFYVARADSLLQLDEWERAEADLKKSVEIAPEEPTALNYLGYSWAERGVNLDEAFDLLAQAVEKEPRSGAITDSVGWAHYKLGNYEKAVTNLEKAVSLEPADPTITDHLGDVYWQLNRPLEARFEWKRALELEPGPKLMAQLREKLANGLKDEPVAAQPASETE